jgi:acetyl esterase/lipase
MRPNLARPAFATSVILTPLLVAVAAACRAQPAEPEPVTHVYATPAGRPLKAYVFSPATHDGGKRAAIVLFHGGGWAVGEPAWAFSRAKHFCERGLVAVAAEYRLSNQRDVTPLEAMADAAAAIRWLRARADSMGVDPRRIAAYGWSAGAHLAASAAVFADGASRPAVSARPDALVLVSPAVSLASDGWAKRLLGDRGRIQDISPDEHVKQGLPPTLVLQGDVDTVTPLSGVRRYCERMRAAGNACTLHVYEGFGHLFTPAGVRDDDTPQPDPTVAQDALERADRFLESLGFLDQR